ncbi:DUF1056 family protein [Schleiferilactobacillus harbinensis]|uniref:DUF1056 family protein n=1 Tax=Schleiferilactobacillus harbinensis TaxID=304207 RepID=UPI0039EC2C30
MRLVKPFRDLIKNIGLFLLTNAETVLLLCGLAAFVYAMFRVSITDGWFGLAGCLVLVAWLIDRVSPASRKGGD